MSARAIARSLVQRGTTQGELSPQPRIFQINGTITSNPTLLFNGEPQNWAGSTIMYDPIESELVGTLEVALDAKSKDGNEFFTLYPGVVYDFTPAQFTWIYFRFTASYVDSALGESKLGRVVVTPTLYANQAGSNVSAPVYVREVPITSQLGSARNGTAIGSNNFQPTGSPGIFAYMIVFPGFVAVGSITGTKVTIKNSGPSAVYLANNIALNDPTDVADVQQTFRLEPGETYTWRSIPNPNRPSDPNAADIPNLAVYTADAIQEIQYNVEHTL